MHMAIHHESEPGIVLPTCQQRASAMEGSLMKVRQQLEELDRRIARLRTLGDASQQVLC